jgi:hypothetical protein
MSTNQARIMREKKTIEAMIQIYCDYHHEKNGMLCLGCQELLEYAKTRLTKCPFQKNKPTCANCLIHCYNDYMRSEIKAVMRYSGPRMLFKHPVLALSHIIDSFRKRT